MKEALSNVSDALYPLGLLEERRVTYIPCIPCRLGRELLPSKFEREARRCGAVLKRIQTIAKWPWCDDKRNDGNVCGVVDDVKVLGKDVWSMIVAYLSLSRAMATRSTCRFLRNVVNAVLVQSMDFKGVHSINVVRFSVNSEAVLCVWFLLKNVTESFREIQIEAHVAKLVEWELFKNGEMLISEAEMLCLFGLDASVALQELQAARDVSNSPNLDLRALEEKEKKLQVKLEHFVILVEKMEAVCNQIQLEGIGEGLTLPQWRDFAPLHKPREVPQTVRQVRKRLPCARDQVARSALEEKADILGQEELSWTQWFVSMSAFSQVLRTCVEKLRKHIRLCRNENARIMGEIRRARQDCEELAAFVRLVQFNCDSLARWNSCSLAYAHDCVMMLEKREKSLVKAARYFSEWAVSNLHKHDGSIDSSMFQERVDRLRMQFSAVGVDLYAKPPLKTTRKVKEILQDRVQDFTLPYNCAVLERGVPILTVCEVSLEENDWCAELLNWKMDSMLFRESVIEEMAQE